MCFKQARDKEKKDKKEKTKEKDKEEGSSAAAAEAAAPAAADDEDKSSSDAKRDEPKKKIGNVFALFNQSQIQEFKEASLFLKPIYANSPSR